MVSNDVFILGACRDSLQQWFSFFFKQQRFFFKPPSSIISLSLTKTSCCHCRLGAGGQCRRCLAVGRPGVKSPGDGYVSSSPTPMAAGAWLIEVATNCLLTELKDSVTPSNSWSVSQCLPDLYTDDQEAQDVPSQDPAVRASWSPGPWKRPRGLTPPPAHPSAPQAWPWVWVAYVDPCLPCPASSVPPQEQAFPWLCTLLRQCSRHLAPPGACRLCRPLEERLLRSGVPRSAGAGEADPRPITAWRPLPLPWGNATWLHHPCLFSALTYDSVDTPPTPVPSGLLFLVLTLSLDPFLAPSLVPSKPTPNPVHTWPPRSSPVLSCLHPFWQQVPLGPAWVTQTNIIITFLQVSPTPSTVPPAEPPAQMSAVGCLCHVCPQRSWGKAHRPDALLTKYTTTNPRTPSAAPSPRALLHSPCSPLSPAGLPSSLEKEKP